MKIRIAASIALAAGLALGLSGCNLIAHQATAEHYAPSDGVEVTAEGVALRNIILVADESGENFNVVFTAVNNTGAPASVQLEFAGDGAQASLAIELEPGSTSFGNPDEGQQTLVISLPGLKAGASVQTYFTVNGKGDHTEFVPVLDGTLLEYTDYVLTARDLASAEDDEASADSSGGSAAGENADGSSEDSEEGTA